jgi:hypothetical protein
MLSRIPIRDLKLKRKVKVMGEAKGRMIQGALSGVGEDLDLDELTAELSLSGAFGVLEPIVPNDLRQLSMLGETVVELGRDDFAIVDQDGLHIDCGIIDR